MILITVGDDLYNLGHVVKIETIDASEPHEGTAIMVSGKAMRLHFAGDVGPVDLTMGQSENLNALLGRAAKGDVLVANLNAAPPGG